MNHYPHEGNDCPHGGKGCPLFAQRSPDEEAGTVSHQGFRPAEPGGGP